MPHTDEVKSVVLVNRYLDGRIRVGRASTDGEVLVTGIGWSYEQAVENCGEDIGLDVAEEMDATD